VSKVRAKCGSQKRKSTIVDFCTKSLFLKIDVDGEAKVLWIVLVMQHAQNGTSAEKGIKVGDKVRTPQGLILEVNLFNLAVIQRAINAGWPNKPHATPQKFAGPRLLFKRRGEAHGPRAKAV
jgi:hypothetical protein